MNILGRTLRPFALFILSCHLLITVGQSAAAPAFLNVEEISGRATWSRPDKPDVKITQGMTIPIEGLLATGPKSRVLLRLPNNALISLGENSEVELLGYNEDASETSSDEDTSAEDSPASTTELKLRRGVLTNHVRKLKTGASYKVNTPLGVAGVRGTTFQVRTSQVLESSTVSVHGIVSENWVQTVTVATTDGLVGFDADTGHKSEIKAGIAMVAGDPADSGPDGTGMRTRTLTQKEIDEINYEVCILPPKKKRYIGGGGPRSPYNLRPTDERFK